MAETILLHITNIRTETPTVKTYTLEAVNGKSLPYKAGQFITFLFTINGEEVRRSYSFSSAPTWDQFLKITIKRQPNGIVSRWIFDTWHIGMKLHALPAAGIFTIPYQQYTPRDIFLIAAGSGITPIYSLLKDVLIKEPQSSITLIYSNSSRNHTIFYDELVTLQARFNNQLHIEFLFSDHQQILQARLSSTSLKLLLDRHLHYNKSNALLFTCGPFDFMQMVQIIALTNGFKSNHIRREIFTLPDITYNQKIYIDNVDRTITLIKNGISHNLFVPHQQSILTAALINHIDLPYSCKAGRCSSCRAQLLQGKVQMHYNEVLTDEDEANGYILTCTGHPVSDDVIVKLDF
jgi:ring-1,2-phenylacetyl-CoA epoxidase subunit PaaE